MKKFLYKINRVKNCKWWKICISFATNEVHYPIQFDMEFVPDRVVVLREGRGELDKGT